MRKIRGNVVGTPMSRELIMDIANGGNTGGIEEILNILLQRIEALEEGGDATLTIGYNGNLWLNGKDTGIKMPTDSIVSLMFDYESLWLEGDDYYSKFENAKSAFLDGKAVTLEWCEPYSSNITRCPCIRYNEGWDHPGGVEYLLFSAWTDGDVLEAYRLTPDGQVERITKQVGGNGGGGEDDPGEDGAEDIRFNVWGDEFGAPSGYTWREAIDQGLIYGVSDQIAYGCVGCGESYAFFSYSDSKDKVWRDTCPNCDGSYYELVHSDGPDAATVSPDEFICEQTYYVTRPGDDGGGDDVGDGEGEATEMNFYIGNSQYIIGSSTTFEELYMYDFFLRDCGECGGSFSEVWVDDSDGSVYCKTEHGCVEETTTYRVVREDGSGASAYSLISDGDQFYLGPV